MKIECSCGMSIDCTLPFYCRCGRLYEPEGIVAATCCRWLGKRAGWATCRCGLVFACNLHGGLCSERTAIDDLVEIHFDDGSSALVMDVKFRSCGGCDDYANGRLEEKTPVP